MRTLHTFAALSLLAAIAPVAHAATVTLSFSGVDTHHNVNTADFGAQYGGIYTQTQYYIDYGTVTFTYPDGLTTLTAADLTGFTLSRSIDNVYSYTYSLTPSKNGYVDQGVMYPGYGYLQVYSQGISGLTDFSATVSPTGTVSALSFDTAAVSPNVSAGWPISSFIATTTSGTLDYSTTTTNTVYPNGIFTTGTLAQAVPEPASLGLIVAGALALTARRRRM